MNNKQIDPLIEIKKLLSEELTQISLEQTKYFQAFPKNSLIGFVTDEKSAKKLAEEYYKFIAFTAASISQMEDALSALPSIMLNADKSFQFDRITICDEMLTQYGEFKKAVSHFAELNERLIIKKQISASEMLKYLSELGHKLSYFDEYLKDLSL